MSMYRSFTWIYTKLSVFNNVLVQNAKAAVPARVFKIPEAASGLLSSKFHTTSKNGDLMEFFEDEKNWDSLQVKVGRAWKLSELRIKSNSDLHKLWFVLLKERNMLLTMEHEYRERYVVMPNSERMHKVEESMKNLETVVRERNKAYYLLETGETGEQDVVEDVSGFGLPYKRKLTEHYVEKQYDKLYKMRSIARHRNVFDRDVVWFLKKLNDKKRRLSYRANRLKYKHVCGLLRRFQNIDEEALKEEFPDIDIEEAKQDRMSRGPRVNLY